MEGKRIGVISLGCDKNRVDTEKMLFVLSKKHVLVNEIENAEIVVINTCAFLESARVEALNEIFNVAKNKGNGTLEKIIITGCLPQKFIQDIYDELVEVDGFLGVSDYQNINDVIDRVYFGERVNAVGKDFSDCGKDRILTTDNYAYLKIADGCSNHCTYCLIPKIRGAYRSAKKQDLIEEAKSLGDVKELILVAQDTTRYGLDLEEKSSLPDLIRSLSALPNVKGIRLLYCYPEGITDELINEFKSNAKLIRYIDIPFQHADDRILKLMNRKGSFDGYISLINKLKSEISGIAIRSTFIAGFPQEDETAFNRLVEFIEKANLDNVGFFKYSKEEDTPAFKLEGHLEESVKSRRVRKLYSVQKAVVKKLNKQKIGRVYKVKAEGFDRDRLTYYGRAYFNAPEIDGKIYFFSSEQVVIGEFYDVKILNFDGYDLIGERIL